MIDSLVVESAHKLEMGAPITESLTHSLGVHLAMAHTGVLETEDCVNSELPMRQVWSTLSTRLRACVLSALFREVPWRSIRLLGADI